MACPKSPRQASSSTPERSMAFPVIALMGLLCLGVGALAQQPGRPIVPTDAKQSADEKQAPDADRPDAVLEDLAITQGKVADKYARLEQLLIRMAEIEATNNPQRAALLKRAAQQSTDRLTRQQLNSLIKLLAPPGQLKRAIDEQQQVVNDLKALLELLQSENRSDRLKSEQARIREYLKDLDRIIRLQKAVQGRTEGGDDEAKLSGDQEGVANRTDNLAKRIQENEEGRSGATPDEKSKTDDPSESKSGDSKSGDSKSGDSKSGDSKSGDSKSGDSKSGDSKSGDSKSGDSKSGDSKSGDPKSGDPKGDKSKSDASKGDKNDESAKSPSSDEKNANDKSKSEKGASGGKSTPGKSQKSSGGNSKSKKSSPSKSPGQPGEPSESSESPPDADQQQQEQQNPARKRLQAAEERMREAQRKLAEAKRKDAVDDQIKAREELDKAKAELEQILRQLREEEIERTLALLEGRFRRMLEAQIRIYESTRRLDRIPANERTRDVDILASKLGFDESKLAVEAEKALLLLREEGSSVALPETVEMIRDDMQQVSDRLSQTRIDSVTQGLEEEITRALDEVLAALQKAQQEMKDRRQNASKQKAQPMDPRDRPLVDKLAELKMIKSLQLRVNTRTQRYARLLDDIEDPVGRANDADLRQSLGKLAELEQRVFDITRNIVLGKNE